MQDDWQIASSVKLLYGVRYDFTSIRAASADAPLAQTHEFNIDKNNFGPRVGVAWSIDQEHGASRERRADVRSADSRRIRAGAAIVRVAARAGVLVQRYVGGRAGVSEAVPTALSVSSRRGRSIRRFRWRTPGSSTPRSSARSPSDFTAFVGVMYAKGNQLPVVTDINLINPTGFFADGRPIYSTAVNASTREPAVQSHHRGAVDRRLDVQVGDDRHDQAVREGCTFQAQYSLGKGLDNTPLLTQLTVQSEADDPIRAISIAISGRTRSTCAIASTADSCTRR